MALCLALVAAAAALRPLPRAAASLPAARARTVLRAHPAFKAKVDPKYSLAAAVAAGEAGAAAAVPQSFDDVLAELSIAATSVGGGSRWLVECLPPGLNPELEMTCPYDPSRELAVVQALLRALPDAAIRVAHARAELCDVAPRGATWTFRGDESRRRRGCDADIPSRPARASRYANFARQEHVPRRELVVYDTGSQPSAFFSSLDDARVRYRHGPDDARQGLGAKRNWLVDAARGDVVACFDDDNVYGPAYLQTMVSHLERSGARCVCLVRWCSYNAGGEKCGAACAIEDSPRGNAAAATRHSAGRAVATVR